MLINERKRGRQSADWAQRLQPFWPELVAEVRKIGELATERSFLNISKIQDTINIVRTIPDDAADDPNLRMLIRSLIFSRFLRYEEVISNTNTSGQA
nr:hypothetical protein [Desulforamulus aquiferis]